MYLTTKSHKFITYTYIYATNSNNLLTE